MSRPPGVLLPILQETDWTGQTLAVVRPLAGFEGAHVPWVSFAYTDAQRRYTVTPSALEDESGGRRVGNVTLEVPGTQRRFRTWGYTRYIDTPGTWRAVVVDHEGNELASQEFEVH